MSPTIWIILVCVGLLLGAATIVGARSTSALRILAPVGAYGVVGMLLGMAAVFGVTLMIQQDTKPPLPGGDPGSSVLNRVEYGNRS
ncbi:hypothetical protein Mkiyose1665_23670 [Mycobacterium kiyosense]|uniref:DUF2613 domain-containing protein n=1 Tax=Mycobacterium kiyosense TaxID=2871094 RepID=A0A9P3UZW5_9MYCO|nr:hypothetical protein IWGMT90018_05160 [Mycobacterium kiyosense]BDE11907.1 hypothetical protein MKCMC460_07670 [Mycobacterium sp. 20KCMC460]GLB84962.1 hypothetical protein SRL2020028_42180 [Mycobacterium kiyosense]GLB92037.1 hypothetical protein SRL2020130_48540 [Mycobacterium kiyosense]GLB98172.1 hypothetical protein SRL2020226_49480 [Mycobacterium kiyosense]